MPYQIGRDVDRQADKQEGRYASRQLNSQEAWKEGRQAKLENTIEIVVYT
jgi:hypothetical protein